jgi:hypothetical protein
MEKLPADGDVGMLLTVQDISKAVNVTTARIFVLSVTAGAVTSSWEADTVIVRWVGGCAAWLLGDGRGSLFTLTKTRVHSQTGSACMS